MLFCIIILKSWSIHSCVFWMFLICPLRKFQNITLILIFLYTYLCIKKVTFQCLSFEETQAGKLLSVSTWCLFKLQVTTHLQLVQQRECKNSCLKCHCLVFRTLTIFCFRCPDFDHFVHLLFPWQPSPHTIVFLLWINTLRLTWFLQFEPVRITQV